MRIVSIISSYRKNGNTDRLVRCMEESFLRSAEMENLPVELETVYLGHENIGICRGCRVCFDKGEQLCPLKDELLGIRDKIREADGIILASPVYVEDVNGIMKNWIDRMAFHNHRPAFAGKPAVLITTSGIGSSNHALKTMNNALHAWGFHVVGKGKYRTGDIMEVAEIKNRYGSKIKNMAKALFDAVVNEKPVNPSFYSLLAFKVQQKYWQKTKKKQASFDFSYWQNNGWLKRDCEYYIHHNASPVKVVFARFFGSIVSRFFA